MVKKTKYLAKLPKKQLQKAVLPVQKAIEETLQKAVATIQRVDKAAALQSYNNLQKEQFLLELDQWLTDEEMDMEDVTSSDSDLDITDEQATTPETRLADSAASHYAAWKANSTT